MSIASPSLARLKVIYEMAEQNYARTGPLELISEAADHSQQRTITIESFALITAQCPEIQFFNEMLIRYMRGATDFEPGRVVPDNFVASYREPLVVDESFNTFRQPVGPLLVLDYVSRLNFRKDYLDSFRKYEIDLKVPYYLLFYPHKSELFVFRLADEAYAPIEPNSMGRLAIPELELEVAVLDGWVRYWFRGNLIPLPGEMLKRLEASQNQAISLQDQLDAARTELAELKANANGTA